MFILKSKIKDHIGKVRISEQSRQERIWQKKIDILESDHKKEIARLKSINYKKIHEKNQEIKRAREAWHKYRDKALEFVSIAQQMENFTQVYKLSASEMFQQSAKIADGIGKAERFILNNEIKIERLLGIE